MGSKANLKEWPPGLLIPGISVSRQCLCKDLEHLKDAPGIELETEYSRETDVRYKSPPVRECRGCPETAGGLCGRSRDSRAEGK